MVESVNLKRAFLPKGKQNKLINKILSKITVKDAAKLCNLSERTIRDWRREKFSMNIGALRNLCKKTNIPIPSNIKLKDRYWYVYSGSSAGALAVLKKYGRIGGNPEYRKRKWYEWWEKEGRFKKHPIINVCASIRKPRKSKDLAEFVGIMIGDGGITKRQIVISQHSINDRKYSFYIVSLLKKLFGIQPSIYKDKNALVIRITISRSKLVNYCQSIGLKIGNKIKQKVDIPQWIKHNRNLMIVCIRGLFDTDGSVFEHRYKVNSKIYKYKKFSFSSASFPLIKSIYSFLKKNGFHPRITKDNREVRLDSIEDMKKYFYLVGSHNPKHLKRYLE